MTRLINLLSWLPGHSGFGSYVQRVVPQLDGLRLQLGVEGQVQLVPASEWTTHSPPWAPARSMRFLQRYSLVQHGLDLHAHREFLLVVVEVPVKKLLELLVFRVNSVGHRDDRGGARRADAARGGRGLRRSSAPADAV